MERRVQRFPPAPCARGHGPPIITIPQQSRALVRVDEPVLTPCSPQIHSFQEGSLGVLCVLWVWTNVS